MGLFALLLLRQALALLLQPGAVVALPWNAATAVHFQNPFGRVVQEVAVVGDGHYGAAEAFEEHLQPLDRFGVQVVGRLVQQQHVGLGQQQAAQRHAAFFTTRQQADLGVPGRQTQRIGGDFQLVLGVGAGGGNDGFEFGLLGGQRVEVGVFFAIGDVHLFQALFGRKHRTHRLFHRFTHRVLVVEFGFLLQVTDAQACHGQRFTLVFLVDTGHDLEQRGLARAIEAEHANLGTREKREGNVLQELAFGRHRLADAVHGINVLGHR